jgi:hypothetical protein
MDVKKQHQLKQESRRYLQSMPARYAYEENLLDDGSDALIEEYSRDTLLKWQAPEFEMYEKSPRWYLLMALALAFIVIYAVISNSLIMAITFILIGIVGYVYLQKEPRNLTFAIAPDGVIVGNEIYDFEDMHSFWIFYDPPHEKILSLHMKGRFMPFIHIPIHKENPVEIRHTLLNFVPEIKQEHTLVDAFERILHL